MAKISSSEAAAHADRIADDLVGIIDYASRVLISASYGSAYQRDKLHGLRDKPSPTGCWNST